MKTANKPVRLIPAVFPSHQSNKIPAKVWQLVCRAAGNAGWPGQAGLGVSGTAAPRDDTLWWSRVKHLSCSPITDRTARDRLQKQVGWGGTLAPKARASSPHSQLRVSATSGLHGQKVPGCSPNSEFRQFFPTNQTVLQISVSEKKYLLKAKRAFPLI